MRYAKYYHHSKTAYNAGRKFLDKIRNNGLKRNKLKANYEKLDYLSQNKFSCLENIKVIPCPNFGCCVSCCNKKCARLITLLSQHILTKFHTTAAAVAVLWDKFSILC